MFAVQINKIRANQNQLKNRAILILNGTAHETDDDPVNKWATTCERLGVL